MINARIEHVGAICTVRSALIDVALSIMELPIISLVPEVSVTGSSKSAR